MDNNQNKNQQFTFNIKLRRSYQLYSSLFQNHSRNSLQSHNNHVHFPIINNKHSSAYLSTQSQHLLQQQPLQNKQQSEILELNLPKIYKLNFFDPPSNRKTKIQNNYQIQSKTQSINNQTIINITPKNISNEGKMCITELWAENLKKQLMIKQKLAKPNINKKPQQSNHINDNKHEIYQYNGKELEQIEESHDQQSDSESENNKIKIKTETNDQKKYFQFNELNQQPNEKLKLITYNCDEILKSDNDIFVTINNQGKLMNKFCQKITKNFDENSD